MTAILILTWVGVVFVSYQGALMVLKKSNQL